MTPEPLIDPDLIDRDDINDYGSSATPVILGLVPQHTPLQEFCLRTGRAEPRPVNWQMRKGKLLESLYLERFVEETGIQVEKPRKKFVHPDFPWMVCHVDGLSVDGETLVEVKHSDAPSLWAEGVADSCTAQVQHQAACIPSVERIFVALGLGREWSITEIHPDCALQEDYIIPMIDEFRTHVQRDETPPPSSYEECYQAFGLAKGKAIEMNEGLRLWIEEMEELSRSKRSAEAKLKQVKFQLAEAMGSAEHITIRNMPVLTRAEVIRKSYTVKVSTYATMKTTKWWEKMKDEPEGETDV
jgi:hypothetical protein